MKKIIFVVLCILSNSVFAYYNPVQLKTFEATGACVGCDLTNTYLGVHPNVKTPFNLQKSNLTDSSLFYLSNATLSNFSGAVAISTSFQGMALSQADFANTILINAGFVHANLTYTNFSGAVVKGVNFSDANLYRSNISSAQLATAASVCGAILPNGTTGKCNN